MTLFFFIFVLLMTGYAVLIEFYHRAWSKMPVHSLGAGRPEAKQHTRVSVIVSLRNEADNVQALMQSLLSQDYPPDLFEIILVDDHSNDDTWKLLQAYAFEPNVRLYRLQDLTAQNQDLMPPGLKADPDDARVAEIRLPPVGKLHGQSFKKAAIARGAAMATGKLIVTTDADCTAGAGWLSTLVNFYENNNAAFIAAPVVLTGGKGLLPIFQVLDFITLQGITGASVAKKFHAMCNGANLAYEKTAFEAVNGFEGIDEIPSGDDMLLMYKIYKMHPDRVHYLKHKSAIVETAAATTWKQFFHQRIRWASKAVHYDDKTVFRVLLLVYLVNVCFVIAAIAAFFKLNYLWFFILMLFAKVLIEFPFVNNIALFFGRQRLMKYFPFMQPFHIIYTVLAGWLGRFGSYEWKGRKIITHGTVTKRT